MNNMTHVLSVPEYTIHLILLSKCTSQVIQCSQDRSLHEFAEMVETSSTVGVNKAQLVGTHDGRVIVPVYNWAEFLETYFKKVPSIKKFHHFRFARDEPGQLYYKQYSTSPEQSLQLLKNPAILPPAVLPAKINPQGLSQERKQYLHREIRQFCKPGTENVVAPAP